MSTPLTADERETLRRILDEAQTEASAGNYSAATEAVQRARAKDPENIYILAFEKQVEQLSVLASSETLNEEARTDILDSLGGIVDRVVAAEPDSKLTEKPAAPPSVATPEDRAAAMEWLKSQYFQQAHQFVRKGEYDHALAEIRRVYIIEPANETARQFEAHIQEIKELHQLVPPQAPSPGMTPSPRPRPSAPQGPASPQLELADHPEAEPAKRRSRGVVIAIIAAAIAFIGFALIYNWVKTSELKQEPPPVVMPQPEVFFSEPAIPVDTAGAATTPGPLEEAAGADTTDPDAGPSGEPAP